MLQNSYKYLLLFTHNYYIILYYIQVIISLYMTESIYNLSNIVSIEELHTLFKEYIKDILQDESNRNKLLELLLNDSQNQGFKQQLKAIRIPQYSNSSIHF